MKQHTMIYMLLSLAYSGLALAKTDTLTILEKGVRRHLSFSQRHTINKQQDTSKEGIILAFKNPTHITISEFETKYSLKFKTKMTIGYYIFENHSSRSDMEIVSDIIANENNIKTVKPNWRLRNTIR